MDRITVSTSIKKEKNFALASKSVTKSFMSIAESSSEDEASPMKSRVTRRIFMSDFVSDRKCNDQKMARATFYAL